MIWHSLTNEILEKEAAVARRSYASEEHLYLSLRTTSLTLLLGVTVAGASLLSCGEPRLTEPEPNTVIEDEVPERVETTDHLYEDGNWYAGWAVTASPELTDAATVEEDRILIPRDEVFDAELSSLSVMDVLVGASPDTGFLRRVLEVQKTDEHWNIATMDADMGEVFLEGEFEFSLNSPPPTMDDDEPEPQPAALTTRRQELGFDTMKTSLEYDCDEDSGSGVSVTSCRKVQGGFSIDFDPQMKVLEDGRGNREIDARTVFNARSEFSESKEMCRDLSSAYGNLNRATQRYSRGVRNNHSSRRLSGYRSEQGEAYKELLEWVFTYGGHSPYRPFVPTLDEVLVTSDGELPDGYDPATDTPGDAGLVQVGLGGLSCFARNTRFFEGYTYDRESVDLNGYCDFADPGSTGNIFYVRSGTNPESFIDVYNLFHREDPFYRNPWFPTTWFDNLFGWEDSYQGDDRQRARIYFAMTPDFRRATYWMFEKIQRDERVSEYFGSRWPAHVRAPADRAWERWHASPEHVEHRGNQWVRAYTTYETSRGRLSPAQILAPFKQAAEQTGDGEFQALITTLETQPLDFTHEWINTALSVGKYYCSSIPEQDLMIGLGAKGKLEWEPKISITQEISNEDSLDIRGSKSTTNQIPLGRVASWFSAGPIPVYMELEFQFVLKSKLSGSADLDLTFRKHHADLDFFFGIRRDADGNWNTTTPEDYEEITGIKPAEASNGEAPIVSANKLEFFNSPNPGFTNEEWREQESLLSIDASVNAKYSLNAGLSSAIILYKAAGFGATFGVDLSAELEVGTESSSVKAEVGPSVELAGLINIPFCGESCASFVKDHLCRFSPMRDTVCKASWCEDKLLCPQVETDTRGRLSLEFPLYKPCKMKDTFSELFGYDNQDNIAQCSAGNPFDFEASFLPPFCFSFCAESNAPSGNEWVAVRVRNFETEPGHPAGYTGMPIDAIYVERDGELIQPTQVEINGSNSPDSAAKLTWCGDDSSQCDHNFESCDFDAMPERTIDLSDYVFVQFEDLRFNDEIVVVRQMFPPQADSEGRRCEASSGELDLYVGSASGGPSNFGYWKQVSEGIVNSSDDLLQGRHRLTRSDFASPDNFDVDSRNFRN